MPKNGTIEKAVAIRYTEELPAPLIVAKGKGEMARAIKRIALEHGVKILDDPELAESLIELDLNAFIPESLYEVIAQLLVFVRTLGQVE